MDPIKIEKFQAMKHYRRKNQFLITLVQYFCSILILGLFLSSPLWLPLVCSSIKHFFMVSLRIIIGPKCLFVLGNIIIIFLVGESKLSGSTQAPDIYEEYVKRNQSLRKLSSFKGEGKEIVIPESCTPVVEESKEKDGGGADAEMRMRCENLDRGEEMGMECEDSDGEEDMGMEDVDTNGEEEMEVKFEDLGGEEEEKGLPADELNRRVEDFIARMNMQRMREARMIVCCG